MLPGRQWRPLLAGPPATVEARQYAVLQGRRRRGLTHLREVLEPAHDPLWVTDRTAYVVLLRHDPGGPAQLLASDLAAEVALRLEELLVDQDTLLHDLGEAAREIVLRSHMGTDGTHQVQTVESCSAAI